MSFGWNFYGFFLFCVVWIGLYFAWAAMMARGDAAAPSEPQASARRDGERAEAWGPASKTE